MRKRFTGNCQNGKINNLNRLRDRLAGIYLYYSFFSLSLSLSYSMHAAAAAACNEKKTFPFSLNLTYKSFASEPRTMN
jgi:hypothetical protein